MMAYQAGYVVAILNNGKTIRESSVNGERVARLPFGSEYVIRIQNKTNKRALVTVKIDGTDTHTGKYVLGSHDKIDLERFVLDGDLSKGNKFKFVEASNGAVQDPTSGDNGHVVVTFEPENTILSGGWTLTTATIPPVMWGNGILRGVGSHCYTNNVVNSASSINVYASSCSNSISAGGTSMSSLPADLGATVEGGASSQQFVTSYENFPVESPVHIGIKLKGIVKEKEKPWKINLSPEPKVTRNGVTIRGITEIQFTASETIVLAAGAKIRIPLDQVMIS